MSSSDASSSSDRETNASAEVPPPSSSSRAGLLLVLCLAAAFAAWVAHLSPQLPEHVATHFGVDGQANGWMSRVEYRNFTLGVGLGTPLLVIGIIAFSKRFNGWGLNISNKQYWLAPERRGATYAFLHQQSLWLAALLILFHGALFYEIMRANVQAPAVLSNTALFSITGVFLAITAVWVARMILHFRLPKK